MQLLFFSTRWGSDALTLPEFLKKSAGVGYDGVEVGIPHDMPSRDIEEILLQSGRHGLKVIFQHYDTYEADFHAHRRKYAAWFEKLRSFRPYMVNSQAGKDFFSAEQNLELIDIGQRFCNENGITLAHETHRNKFSFACHITSAYLKVSSGFQLTLDISHWVNVAESFLEDQQEAVDLALSRTAHLHARIGFPEGPQIPDPRDPRWSQAINAHYGWWDKLAALKRSENVPLTITPEFGPYPYMINRPFSDEPLADQWEINLHMMHTLKQRYS